MLALIARHEAVRQRLHKTYQLILLGVRQSQAPYSFRVHVVGRFRCGPTRRTFAGVVELAARQDVARIVEMHDGFQADEVSVVSIGLNKGGIRPLVHIAQRRHLKARLVAWREPDPSRIHRGRLAEWMALSEETANTAVDE